MNKSILSLAVSLALLAAPIAAQDAKPAAEKKEQTYSSMIANKTAINGLFTLYVDEKTGEHLMSITEA